MSKRFERIVEARMALLQRYEARMQGTPALSDCTPLGSGPRNRHGMPKLPVGQTETKKWPVLDLGVVPTVSSGDWVLSIDGACAEPITLDFDALRALPQMEDCSDFHCVTTWSRFDLRFEGVRFIDLMALVGPLPEAAFVLCYGYDGYSTNLSLTEALKADVLLAHRVDGAALPREHGGPVRMVTPQLYAWKGAKWIQRIELLAEDRPGFWEQRGYSTTAHPWRDDRYG